MTLEFAFKAFVVWLGILMLAIANGALREAVLIPELGKLPGLILSGILLSGVIIAVAYFTLPWIGRAPVASYAVIGMGWLCLTIIFEFTFGHIVQGKPWSQLFEPYMFRGGNIWPIVLLAAAVAPYAAARIMGWV